MQFSHVEQALQADLLWAVSSPDLIQCGKQSHSEGLSSTADAPIMGELMQWLKNNSHQQPLAELISQRQPRRLGIYYEVLWQYILENFPGVRLVARNLPVMDNNRTLGELDFIYYCQQRQRFVHLETAVKFYLGVTHAITADLTGQPQLSWSHWLGPGCKDRLDIKLLKMFNQQTQLSQTPQGRDTLIKLGVQEPLREICLKGYLFYPLSQPFQAPLCSHAKHARGYWLKVSDMHLLEGYSDHWQIFKKEQWLSLLQLQNNQYPLTLDDLKRQLTEQLTIKPFPVMVAHIQPAIEGPHEITRFFITPPNWPTG